MKDCMGAVVYMNFKISLCIHWTLELWICQVMDRNDIFYKLWRLRIFFCVTFRCAYFLHLHKETSLFCFLHKPGETEILPPHVQRDKQSDLQSVVYSVSREGICRHPNGKGLWLISVCWRDLCQLWGSSDVLTIRSWENPRSTLSVISSMDKLRQWLQETNLNSHISTQWWYDSLFSYFCFVSINSLEQYLTPGEDTNDIGVERLLVNSAITPALFSIYLLYFILLVFYCSVLC